MSGPLLLEKSLVCTGLQHISYTLNHTEHVQKETIRLLALHGLSKTKKLENSAR